MTIEERAKAFGFEIFPKSDIENIPDRNGRCFNYDNERKNYELIYKRIAEEQQKIDTGKSFLAFCSVCCNNCNYTNCEAICAGFRKFKKALEE